MQSGVAQQGHGLVAELGPQQNKPVPWHFGSHPKVNEQQCGSYGECRKQNEVLDSQTLQFWTKGIAQGPLLKYDL